MCRSCQYPSCSSPECGLDLLKLFFNSGFPPNTPNGDGNTALHLACRYNRVECVELLLTDMQVDEKIRNKKNQTALDIIYDEDTNIAIVNRDHLKHILYTHFPYLKTLITYHSNCLLHVPRTVGSQGENPWEAPARLPAVMELIHKQLYDWEYEVSSEFEPVDNSKIRGIHSDQYVQMIEDLDAQVG